MSNLPLIEKYRPKTFDEVVGVRDLAKVKQLITTPAEMPNLLFYGPAGTGKTTVAKIVVDTLKPIDYIKINGSDTTGVDTIRDKVYNFMTSMSSVKGMPKIVWIEEFDFMSANAFAALRSMIEQYMINARFICTCNYIHKIPEPIQSRFSVFEFDKLSVEDIEKRVGHVLTAEGITVTGDTFKQIIASANGDIRTALNTFQTLSANATKTIGALDLAKLSGLTDEVYKMLVAGQWSRIRYEVPNKNPDYNSLLVELENKFFTSELEVSKKANVTEVIAQGIYEMASSFDQNICFAAVCSKIIKVL